MYFVYILFNQETEKYYVGLTRDIKRRYYEHKNGLNFSTKYKHDVWKLVYVEIYTSRQDAVNRENKLKHHGSGMVEIKKRIKNTINTIILKTGAGER